MERIARSPSHQPPTHLAPATITIQVKDGDNATVTDTFDITVNSVNDLPTITHVSNQSTDEDTPTAAIPFTIGDVETAAASLVVTATSSNTALVPNANIVLGGSGANRTITLTPALDATGTTTITIQVADGNGGTVTDTFDLIVGSTNDLPTISNVTNQSTSEDTPTGAIAFTVGDTETPAANLEVTATSSNPAVVASGGIVLGGSGANRTITLSPVSNATGTTTITIQVKDGDNATVTDTFDLVVTSVNDLPTISNVTNQFIDEDTATGAIAFTVGDIETAAASLAVTATSSNPALFVGGGIVLGGSGANRTITLTPVANATGTATITIQVQDADGGTVTDTFDVTVTPINDLPTISNVTNQSTNEDTPTGAIAFTVGDIETAAASLTVTATSNNPAVIANGGIVLGGSGTNRTITLSPVSNATGTATITIQVQDANGGTVTDTFDVTVTPVNDLPTVSNVSNQSTDEDTPTGAIPFTVGDIETPAGSLVVTATSSNTGLVPNANIVLGGSGANRTITLTPALDATGTTTITIQVADANGGIATDTFDLIVGSTNDLPTISNVTNQTTSEDTATGAIAFTVGDTETAAANLEVTATSNNPAVIAAGGIVIGGSGANRTITLTPVSNATGTATITIQVKDENNATVTDTFDVTVTPVNDLPTISNVTNQSTNEDTATGAIAFTIGDIETAAGSLVVTATSSNPVVIASGGIAIGGSGANRTITLTPVSNATGTSTITIQVQDADGGTVTDTFDVTVTPVNDLPTITDIGNQSTNEATPTPAIPFTIGDVETAAGSLTVTATSSNTSLVPNANVVLGGSGANRTITLTPVANVSGTTTITVEVADGNGGVATDTFVLSVGSTDDPPTISAVADATINEDTSLGPIAVTLSDPDTAVNSLVLTAASSDQAIIPNANIVLGGSGANRTVTVTPVANASGGPVTITLTVSDATSSAVETFQVQVTHR